MISVKNIVVGLCGASLCASLTFADKAIDQKKIKSISNKARYILKIKPDRSSLVSEDNLVKQKISDLLDVNLNYHVNKTVEKYNFNRILDHTYIVNINDLTTTEAIRVKKLNYDPDIQYITEDRKGYFKPVSDPKPSINLMSDLINYNFTLNSSSLDHHAQWDEFMPPQGVYLESKPFLNDGAWKISQVASQSDKPVVVAVLDTGVEDNTNLSKSLVKTTAEDGSEKVFGWNFSKNNDDLSDETLSYHGTHVSGTIAAHGPSVMGMDTDAKILTVKIPDETGMFYESYVIRALYWSAGANMPDAPTNPYPAKVVNMSFGIDEYIGKEVDDCSPAVQDAIDYARNKGVVLVVAAGNSNAEHDLGAPGGCKGVVRVASTGPTGLRSYFSNYGEGINFAAPGGDKKYGQAGGILSTVMKDEGIEGSEFDYYQGTSMAAPHVAGLASLIYSVADKNLSSEDVEHIMHSTTHDFRISYDPEDSCRGLKSCGHGIINAYNALEATVANYDLVFNSPKSELLDLNKDDSCRDGKVTPKNKNIYSSAGTWVLNQSSLICQKALDYKHPVISLTDDQITANYGHVVYTLHHNLSRCKQVGYDGVGCFK